MYVLIVEPTPGTPVAPTPGTPVAPTPVPRNQPIPKQDLFGSKQDPVGGT